MRVLRPFSVAFGVGTTLAFAAEAIAVVTVQADLAMELSKALALPRDSLLQVFGGRAESDALGGVLDRTGRAVCSAPFKNPEVLDSAAVFTMIDWACANVLVADEKAAGLTGNAVAPGGVVGKPKLAAGPADAFGC